MKPPQVGSKRRSRFGTTKHWTWWRAKLDDEAGIFHWMHEGIASWEKSGGQELGRTVRGLGRLPLQASQVTRTV